MIDRRKNPRIRLYLEILKLWIEQNEEPKEIAEQLNCTTRLIQMRIKEIEEAASRTKLTDF